MDSLSEAHHDAQRHGEREAGLWSKLSSVVACLLKAVAGPGRRFPMCDLYQAVGVKTWGDTYVTFRHCGGSGGLAGCSLGG